MDTHIDYRLPSTHTVVVLFKFMTLKLGVPTVEHTVLRCASLCQCVLAVSANQKSLFFMFHKIELYSVISVVMVSFISSHSITAIPPDAYY